MLRFRGEPFSELQAPLARTVIDRLDPPLLEAQRKTSLVNARAILERQKDSK